MISIIVPVYKVEQYLPKCVDSILSQTYTDIEVILVDDGSPDNCPGICDDYARSDKRVKVAHKTNGGLSDARNAGLDIASGEYIFFVDSDDWIEKEAISVCVQLAGNGNPDIVVTMPYNVISDGNSNVLQNGAPAPDVLMESEDALIEMIYRNNRWSAWGNLYKRSLFENQRFKKGYLYEDLELIPRIVLSAGSVMLHYRPLYNYLLREGSIMRGYDAVVSPQMAEIAGGNIRYFIENVRDEAKQGLLAGGMLSLILLWYENAVILASDARRNMAFGSAARKLIIDNKRRITALKSISVKRKLHFFIAAWMPVWVMRGVLTAVKLLKGKNG